MKKKIEALPHPLLYIINCAYAVAKSEHDAHAIVKMHIELYKHWNYTI